MPNAAHEIVVDLCLVPIASSYVFSVSGRGQSANRQSSNKCKYIVSDFQAKI